jgi:hypothetical protein
VIDAGWDLLGFAQQAADIAAGNMQFLTVPTAGRDSNARGDVVLVEPPAVRTFIEQQVGRQAAEAQAAQARAAEARAAEATATEPVPPPPADLIASRYVVDVSNGSELGGMASSVANHLRGLGFARGIIDNAAATDTSVVRHADSDADAAQAVAEQLGDIDTEFDGSVARGHLDVVLGADFNPAVVPAATQEPPPPPTTSAEPEPTDPITASGVPCID